MKFNILAEQVLEVRTKRENNSFRVHILRFLTLVEELYVILKIPYSGQLQQLYHQGIPTTRYLLTVILVSPLHFHISNLHKLGIRASTESVVSTLFKGQFDSELDSL